MTDMKKVSKDVLALIKKKELKPIPRWEFVLKRSSVWVAFAVAVVLGSVAMSIMFFLLRTNDWEARAHLGSGYGEFLLSTFPYVWLVAMAIFVAIAYLNFRHTEKGYRYKLSVVVGANLLVTLVLGGALFAVGAAKTIEGRILEHAPFYERLHHQKQLERWLQPERGLLAGKLVVIDLEDGEIELEDFSEEEWTVIIENIDKEKLQRFKVGMLVRVLGQLAEEEDDVFVAKDVHPWERNLRPGKRLEKRMRDVEKPDGVRLMPPPLKVRPATR